MAKIFDRWDARGIEVQIEPRFIISIGEDKKDFCSKNSVHASVICCSTVARTSAQHPLFQRAWDFSPAMASYALFAATGL